MLKVVSFQISMMDNIHLLFLTTKSKDKEMKRVFMRKMKVNQMYQASFQGFDELNFKL